MSFKEIPIIDVSDARLPGGPTEEFSHGFTEVCHNVGFAIVTNHGVSATLRSKVFDMMGRFFALSTTQKQQIAKTSSPYFRGWEPVGAESTNNAPDLREQIDIWTEWPTIDGAALRPDYDKLLGPNQWMENSILAGHQTTSLQWIAALAQLADQLMSALAVGLGLHAGFLRNMFGNQPMSLAKFIRYPPTPTGAAGVNAHHDAGFLTVLATDGTPGLEVQSPLGDWVPVPAIADSFVINLGEVMQAITGNYLRATPHRVIASSERLSAGYFHGPSLSTPLVPLPLDQRYAVAVEASPHHQSAGFMPTPSEAESGTGAMSSEYRPETYGNQLWNYFSRSYPEQMARLHG